MRVVDPKARPSRDDGRTPRFVSPRDGEAVIGQTRLEVRPAAGGAALRSVEFLVDGGRIGRVDGVPFEIAWTAPPDRASSTAARTSA